MNPPQTPSPAPPLMVAPGDPRAEFWDLITSAWLAAALHAVVRLHVPEHLAGGRLAIGELADACGVVSPRGLAVLLRPLVNRGWLDVDADGYGLTAAGDPLLPDSPMSMVAEILATGEPGAWTALAALTQALLTGQSPFELQHGQSYDDYLQQNPQIGDVVDMFLQARSAPVAHVVAGLDFSGARTVTDVGGGTGVVLAEVLAAHPHLHGVLLAPRRALDRAAHRFGGALAGRCELLEGGTHDAIPAADVLILSHTIHTLSDTDALRMLAGVAAAVRPGGRVVIADTLRPDDGAPHPGDDLGIRTLTLFPGGHERTTSQYLGLLARAGFTVADMRAAEAGISVLTCTFTIRRIC